jgi:HJR/Mrr/RecB family endonuclease
MEDALDGNIVILLIVIALVVFVIYTRDRPPKTLAAVELTRRLGTVRYMSGAEFEGFVAEIMRGLGYRATVLGGSGDQGVDVIATAGKERLAIQCKNYAKPVGNKPVQEVYAGARYHRCTAAWVVAPEGFTKGAVELARSVGVSLRDTQALRGLIRQIDARESTTNASDGNKGEGTLASKRPDTVTESSMKKLTRYFGPSQDRLSGPG